ncbi:ABC transporter substrate-binding protein [Streptomyces fumanus]|uniref:Uncharacterized protein n=1 Tax=Streptomyces fumanus TaxID=67302 RepID=A0A919AP28_9ACTN|nr:ABC transporter substrate-binding protein [Streptomyces fumanus]GHF17221.1 hypothetical protein GCM10018772_48090 [Streptomyces fumanus]
MTEIHEGVFVNEAHGSVHSGSGAQFNFYVRTAEEKLRERARGRTRTIAEEDRVHIAQRFLAPPGLQRARDRVRDTHTVLIDGLPGSGRRTAALMLLHELPETHGSLHELPDTSDDKSASLLDPGDVGPGDRLLLDLSEVEESRYLDVQGELSGLRSTLIGRGAHLAVVLPHHLAYLLRADLRYLVAEVGRPSPHRVLKRHLRAVGIMPTAEELSGAELLTYLAKAPMRDVAALADRIRHCRDRSPADRGLPDWLARSLAVQQDRSAQVAADLTAMRSGRERALLISTAMFHGATAETVLRATNALLDVMSHPPDTTPRLDRADLHAELSMIGVEPQPDGRVRFGAEGYDRAVRDHFWTFLPDVRRQLRDWFKECLTDAAIGPADREAAITRFGRQVLRTGRPEDLAWLAERWMSVRPWERFVPEASQALAIGLDDERYGRFFRQRVYDWATSAETDNRLRQILVSVCSQTMALTHPDQALVRLHHLARRARGPVAANARQAVLDLAGSDERLYRQMLDRLAAGLADDRWPTDRTLFTELADPLRGLGFATVRASLIACWRSVLRRPVETWAAPVRDWLTAGVDLRHRRLVLPVLAAAAATDTRVSGRVYRVALDWERAGHSDERAATVRDLLRTIDAAQGLDFHGRAA